MPISLNRWVNTAQDRNFRNKTNENWDKLEKTHNAIEEVSEQAVVDSTRAKEQAIEANKLSHSVQEQLDTIVINNGESDAEVLQARVDINGIAHPTVKARADFDFKETSTQLMETSAVLKSKYKLMCDGTDTVDQLQGALNNLSLSGHKNVIFPPNTRFYLTKPLVIPSGMTIDLSDATIEVINTISESPLKLAGSNIRLKNFKLVQKNHNHEAKQGVNGIDFKENKNVDNLFFHNIITEGFEVGINIYPGTGYIANNVKFFNCITNYAEVQGLQVSNTVDLTVSNHTAKYNGIDGLKIAQNTQAIRIIGGNFSYNVNPISTYADGIDLYAGAFDCVISGAVCENNGGVGIHILSAELNDIKYQNPIHAKINNIILSDCICRFNVSAGIDALTKTSVSPTAPYPTSIMIKGCISYSNLIGINLLARHVTISDCFVNYNQQHGIQATSSVYLSVNSCQIIKNSVSSIGAFSGIRLAGCNQVEINGGIINGSDEDYLQKEDGSTLNKYHQYGILISDTENTDQIYINEPSVVNCKESRFVYVTNFNLAENANKKIIVKLRDIGDKPLNNQSGYYGSSLYKDGRKYTKRTNLNSVVWDKELRTNYGTQNFYANGVVQSFLIPHSLGAVPVKYNVVPNRTINSYAVTVDETNLIVTFNQVPPGGTYPFLWEASI
jgi:hypothetical protein